MAVSAVDGRQGLEEVELGGAAAVFSRVCLEEFWGDGAEARTQDPEWVIPRACRHERVVEEVMVHSPVLPVRFGAVFSTRQRLEEVSRKKREEISGFLDDVSDKEEWAVKGSVDLERAGAGVTASDPLLAERRRRMAEAPGTRYFQEKGLRGAVRERLKPWCRSLAEQVYSQLQAHAAAACPSSTRAGSDSGKAAHPILNASFLLSRSRVEGFLACVQRVGGEHVEDGLRLEVSGPWPPYHFCPSIWEAPQ